MEKGSVLIAFFVGLVVVASTILFTTQTNYLQNLIQKPEPTPTVVPEITKSPISLPNQIPNTEMSISEDQTPSPTPIQPTSLKGDDLMESINKITAKIKWGDPVQGTWRYHLGKEAKGSAFKTVSGLIKSSGLSQIGLPDYFDEIDKELKSNGWSESPYQTAEGDGTQWGYEKPEGKHRRVFILLSKIQLCSYSGGHCYKETVFYSDPFLIE